MLIFQQCLPFNDNIKTSDQSFWHSSNVQTLTHNCATQIDFGRELGVQVSDNCFLFNTTSGSADQYNRYNQKEVVTVVSNFTIANECKSCRRLSCEGVSAYTQTDRSVMSFSPSPTPLSVKNLFHSCHVVPLQQLCSSCCCDVTINGVNLGGKTERWG